MLARSLAVIPLARKALFTNASALSVRKDHHGPPADYKFPTMDDLPVPCGSWQEHYDNNQRKYNIHLLFGSGFFLITLVVGITSGAFNLYLFVPERPAPRR